MSHLSMRSHVCQIHKLTSRTGLFTIDVYGRCRDIDFTSLLSQCDQMGDFKSFMHIFSLFYISLANLKSHFYVFKKFDPLLPIALTYWATSYRIWAFLLKPFGHTASDASQCNDVTLIPTCMMYLLLLLTSRLSILVTIWRYEDFANSI